MPALATGLIPFGLALIVISLGLDYQRFDNAFVRIIANDLSVGVVRDALTIARR